MSFLETSNFVMTEDLCPVSAKRSKDAENQPRTVAEANLALLASKRMCDVTFILSGSNPDSDRVQIQAHQLFFRARSLVFDQMFQTCKMGVMTEIEINDVNPDVFKAFLEFIYGDKFDVAMTEALDLLHFAKKYQVEPLIERCEKLLKHEFQIQDAMQVFRKAVSYGMPVWKEKACILLARNMTTLSNESFFLEAEEDLMVELFGRDDLETDEIELFQLALNWGKSRIKDGSNAAELKVVLAKILPLIRFPVMTPKQFATVVIPSKLLPLDDIVDICSYLAQKDRNEDEGSLRFSKARRFQTGKFISFYNMKCGFHQILVPDDPYIETYSFWARVQAAHSLSQSITRKPVITGVRLYLPQGMPKKGDALEFELRIMEFEGDNMETLINERQMFVESRLGVDVEHRLSVSVVPPLELVNGHYYGIVVKGDPCHPSGRAAYTWGSSADLGKRDSSIKLQGQQSSIEIYDFKFPDVIASYKRTLHLDNLQVITGVKVVVP